MVIYALLLILTILMAVILRRDVSILYSRILLYCSDFSRVKQYFCLSCAPAKPYVFVKVIKENNIKDFVTVLIGGILITIPSCYLSKVKIFGIGFLLGLPIIVNLVAFTNTDTVSMENIQQQLEVIITDLNRMLPQLNNFINQFQDYINEIGINVITNAQGSLEIDVANTISDTTAQQYANRINIFDNLIRHHVDSIENLLQRGLVLEDQIRQLNSNYVSQLTEIKNKLHNLINLYKHYKKD